MELLSDIFYWLNDHNFVLIFSIIGVVLILIDYFFKTDVPCQFAYILFSIVIMLSVNYSPLKSLFIGIVAWIVLIILHIVLFRRFLENAPKKD